MKVKNDILLNMNRQHVTLLVLLDLSAAFDTIDHGQEPIRVMGSWYLVLTVSYLRGLGLHLEFGIQNCPGLHHI